jgi:hypothetical protein
MEKYKANRWPKLHPHTLDNQVCKCTLCEGNSKSKGIYSFLYSTKDTQEQI